MALPTLIAGILLLTITHTVRADNDTCEGGIMSQSNLDVIKQLLEKLNQCTNNIDCFPDTIKHVESERGGAVYTRWGRTDCPETGTERIYEGYIAGAHYNTGSAANYLCLPKEPLWGKYHDGYDEMSEFVYGTEFELHFTVGDVLDRTKYFQEDVPCAVCHSTIRSAVYMVPGRNVCYNGWHIEYTGYLMSQKHNQKPSEYICVDKLPDTVPDASTNDDGRFLYPVEVKCGGSLKCPPYVEGRELTCVVCTK